jgi:hypothetical protein
MYRKANESRKGEGSAWVSEERALLVYEDGTLPVTILSNDR